MKIELAQINRLSLEEIQLVCSKLGIDITQVYRSAFNSFWECCKLIDEIREKQEKILDEGEDIPEYLTAGLEMVSAQKDTADELIQKIRPVIPKMRYAPTKAGLKRLLSEG